MSIRRSVSLATTALFMLILVIVNAMVVTLPNAVTAMYPEINQSG